ncbi:MAG: hypothetical protein GY839_02830 [candidate division Zixibacteria bacterium]|nr:hypothetical protein [candidate division Zixibacteria bacterium]
MNYLPNIDRRSLAMIAVLVVSIVLLLTVTLLGLSNIYGRYARLSDAENYASGAGKLEINQKAFMDRYFNLQRISKELKGDSISVSYNSRVGSVLEKIKSFDLELKEIEYNKESNDGDIFYLPVKFELSGGFDRLMQFTHYIENEIQVMGFTGFEMATSGASSADIEMSATINFYRLDR